MWLLGGLAAAILLWAGLKSFAGADPKRLAKLSKQVGGTLALGVAGLLVLRGRIDVAIPLGGFGAWLLGLNVGLPASLGRRTRPSPGAVSPVRSAAIEMELDHETGAMRGTMLAGAFAGRALEDLSEAELVLVGRDCAGDPDSERLLDAYLDRRFPGRARDAQPDPDAGPGRAGGPGPMTPQEAHQILGLEPGAGDEAIRAAHRALMKRLHPDQGGSTYLAARVNEAKDLLLHRHR